MNTIDERLWDYIDGTCSQEERTIVEKLLQQDAEVKKLYDELVAMHRQLQATDLEEPSLRFSQNVMEQIALEPAPKIVTTKVDKRIINGIGGFFLITILALLVYTLGQVNWSAVSPSSVSYKLPSVDWSNISLDWSKIFNQNLLVFLVVYEVAGLYLLDKFLRRRKTAA